MTLFYECGYPMRIAFLIFLIVTILTLLFLLWLFIKWKCGTKKAVLCALALGISFGLYTILLDDHITPIDAIEWTGHHTPIPIAVLWIFTLSEFVISSISIMQTHRQYLNTVTEENIKEALDEVPLAIGCFKEDGIAMLCNRRLRRISEMLSGRIFLNYSEFKEMLTQRDEWKENGDIFRFPDGSVCRYSEEEPLMADGKHVRFVKFFDITALDEKKRELETQNEELVKMSVELQRLKENVRLLAKEEEILSTKARWHDVMGEGLTTIRRTLLSTESQETMDETLKRWWDTVRAIQRDNEDPDQRRDEVGDLLRDAQGLQVKLKMEGELPVAKETRQVFILAMRNCLLNAVQHAEATEVHAVMDQKKKTDILTVTNNGKKPDGEIVPRGGLVNVKNHVERFGGTIEIQSVPHFELKITIPNKEVQQ